MRGRANRRGAIIALALAAAVSFAPDAARSQMFTSEEFLTWDRDAQGFYFQTSIGMAGLIAAQNDKAQADCIDRWFFADQDTAHDFIVGAMRKFPEFHPRGVILAVIEKKCGSMTY